MRNSNDKWMRLKRWLIDTHREMLKSGKVTIEDTLNMLDKMDDLEREDIELDRKHRLDQLSSQRSSLCI
jgi:hypothetical protein